MVLPLHPWRPAGGATETTWWYHVKITMENVPLEAWNDNGVKMILGDGCILDRLDSCTVAREPSEILTCWAWMEDLGDLPRSLGYSFFAARAGQAMETNGLASPARIPSAPPKGKFGDEAILIHLAGYEDWRPRSPDATGFGTSSRTGCSAPTFIPFPWTPGVLDGRQPAAGRWMPQPCRAPPLPQGRREHDRDDDNGPRPRNHDSGSTTSRVRQLFHGCSSDRAIRVCTRSPTTYCQAVMANMEPAERGRSWSRSCSRSSCGRDYLQHAADDWERHRSWSPTARERTWRATPT